MRKPWLLACALLVFLATGLQDAEAKRLAGGIAKGVQREPVTQHQVASPQPTAPTQQIAPHPPTPTPNPVPAGKRSLLGPLAGLAAGIGLGALLAHVGLGESVGSLLALLLLIGAAVLLIKWLLRRPADEAAPDMAHSLAYGGVGGPAMAPPPALGAAERELLDPELGSSVKLLSRNIPADFDQEGFLRTAKANFLRLQLTNDAAKLDDLREFVTPEMFAELQMAIADRQVGIQQTEVVGLEAELLEVVDEMTQHLASIRFHGLIREHSDAPALPFDEVWHLSKPAEGSRGWVLAGIQQLN